MPLPYPKQEANSRDRAKHLLRGYASGGDVAQDRAMIAKGVHAHERNMHAGKPPTKLKLASGGVAEGAPACARMDRAPRARGGKAGKGKKATHVNVIVNAGKQEPDMPMGGLAAGPPPGLPPAMPSAPPPMPPKPMGPMPGGPMPGGAPMGGPMPMMGRARGGRAAGGKTQQGPVKVWTDEKGNPVGQPRDKRLPPLPLDHPVWDQEGNANGRARGGKVYDAGAGSGEGRIEKVENYGANAKIKDTTRAVKGVKGDGKTA